MRLLFATTWSIVMIAGCGTEPQTSNQKTPVNEPISAFTFEQSKNRILLDTRIPPKQMRRFDIGLGSITIETISASDNVLTIYYTPEVEGGYTTYLCRLPISKKPVTFEIDPSGCPGNTSFKLEECKVLKTGSLHFDEN